MPQRHRLERTRSLSPVEGATTFASDFATEGEGQMSTTSKPSIVFCHGLWADGSCFSKVISALQADGHEVIAVQYGLNSYADDVATVKRTLGRVNSPAI